MLRNILHLTASQGFSAIINLVIIMLLSRFLSIEDYALFRQSFLVNETLIPILALGIPASIYYLLPNSQNEILVIIQSLVIVVISGLLFYIISITSLNNLIALKFENVQLKNTLRITSIYPSIQIPLQILLATLIFNKKTKFVGVVTFSTNIVLLTFIFLAALLDSSIETFLYLKVFIPLIALGLYFVGTLKYYEGILSLRLKELFHLRKILKVSLPFGLASMIGTLAIYSDKFIVSFKGSSADYAVYINGAQELPFIGIITGSISAVIVGEMSKKIKLSDINGAALLFRKAATSSALVIFPIFLFFLVNAADTVTLLFSEKYIQSYIPFTIYLMLLPIRIVVFGSALMALGKGTQILLRSVLDLFLNIVLSLICFEIFGIWGIPIATVIVTYLWSVPYNIRLISKGFQLEWYKIFDFRKLGLIGLCSVILTPFLILIRYMELDVIYTLGIAASIYFLGMMLLYERFKLIPTLNTLFLRNIEK